MAIVLWPEWFFLGWTGTHLLYLWRLITGALGGEYPLVLSDSGSSVLDDTAIQIRSEDGGENQQNMKQSSF